MIAALMLRAVAAAALVGLAAACADGVARQFGLPRRWIWAAALTMSLALPLAGGWLPAPGLLDPAGVGIGGDAVLLETLTFSDGADLGVVSGSPARPSASAAAVLDRVLLIGWLGGSTALLAVLIWTGTRLRAARREGLSGRVGGVPAVLADGLGPAVVGVVRPSVLLPAWVNDLPPVERRLVAAHEWEHVRGRDTLLLAAAAAALVAAPWNLVLWWQHRMLREAIETDCDARLLARGVDRRAYALVLLQTAGRTRGFPLLSPSLALTRSTLERRILAMTYRAPRHRLARSGGLVALGALGLAAACDFASNRPVNGPTAPERVEDPAVIAGETPVAAEGADIILVETTDPKDWVVIAGVEGDDDLATYRISRSSETSVDGESALVRARSVTLDGAGTPIYFVDGVRVEKPELEALEIAEIEVIKGEAAARVWGEEGENGVVRITTGTSAAAGARVETLRVAPTRVRSDEARVTRVPSGDAAPIYLVDGVRVQSPDVQVLDIERIEVVKGAAARAILGEEAANGVVRITTKAAAALQSGETTEQVRTRSRQVQEAAESAREAAEATQVSYGRIGEAAASGGASAERVRQVAERLLTEVQTREFDSDSARVTFMVESIRRAAFAASGEGA